MAEELNLPQLRFLTLESQGLTKPYPFGKGKDAVLKALEHLGYLQIDTLSIVERAHHHTLWTRIPDYTTEYLDELVEESISELKSFVKLHEIELELIINDSTEIKGFPNLLKIAIKNAIKNAIQFSHKNSKVILNIFEKNDEIIVSIQDFGIGISKDEQLKIFEKFYRTDKSRNKNSGGTGLGMSIMKKIIDIHNGKINIESTENKGTIVEILFQKNNIF